MANRSRSCTVSRAVRTTSWGASLMWRGGIFTGLVLAVGSSDTTPISMAHRYHERRLARTDRRVLGFHWGCSSHSMMSAVVAVARS